MPAVFDAVSRTKIVLPTSDACTVYDDPAGCDAPQLVVRRLTVTDGVGAPVTFPPCTTAPAPTAGERSFTTGGAVFTGAAWTTEVCAESAETGPSAFVTVTR